MADDNNPFARFVAKKPEEDNPFAQFARPKPETPAEADTGNVGAYARALPTDGAASSHADGKDNRSWTQWARDSVMGRHDPVYHGIPTFDEAMQEENKGNFFASPEIRRIRTGAMTAGDDAIYGDIMKAAIGDRFIRKETDANGYDVIVYHGKDGTEKKAYVNRPGLDAEDVSRGLASAIPYGLAGLAAAYTGGTAPLIARGVVQGLSQAGTSIGMDMLSKPLGSEQGVDKTRAGIMGAMGVAGELAAPAVAAAWRNLVTVPGLFDAAVGRLTPKGYQVAIDIGLDPNTFTKDMAKAFAKEYAITGDAAAAGRQVAASDLGIVSTVGQRSKNPLELLEEMSMRKGLKGTAAQEEMKRFDDLQAQQLTRAAMGDAENAGAGNLPNSKGIAAALNPSRDLKDVVPAELGTDIKEGVKAAQRAARDAENQAWQGLHNVTAHPDAMKLLPQAIGTELGDRAVDQTVTPAAYNMAKMLQGYMSGDAMKQPFEVLGQTAATPTVDGMRRRLLAGMGGAATPEDRAVAGKIYDGFNNWIKEAADAQLLAGHPDAAVALRSAREISREVKDLFQPRDRSGTTAAGRIIDRVLSKEDTPEGVVRALVGTPSSDLKTGTVDALSRMKKALDTYGGPEGVNTWNDIRSAYYMRMVTEPTGKLLSPQKMLTSIEKAFGKQKSALDVLFTKDELGQMKKLQKSLEQITYKDPNPSGSGYAIAQFVKDAMGKLLSVVEMVPGGGYATAPLRVAGHITSTARKEMAGAKAAAAATSQVAPRTPPPALGPQASLLAQQYLRMREPERRD